MISFVDDLSSTLRRWALIAYVARASLLNVCFLGALLLLFNQIHEILREISTNGLFGLDSLGLYLSLTAWAVTTHYCARVMVEFDFGLLPDAPADRTPYRAPITWLPRFIGFGCFVVVAAGFAFADPLLVGILDPAVRRPTFEDLTSDHVLLHALLALDLGLIFTLYAIHRKDLASLRLSTRAVSFLSGLPWPAPVARAGRWLTKHFRHRMNAEGGEGDPVQPILVPSAIRWRRDPDRRATVKTVKLHPEGTTRLVISLTLFVSLFLALGAAVALFPLSVGQFLTKAGVLFLAATAWLPFLALLTFIGHWRDLPMILVTLALAGVLHGLAVDNHAIATLPGTGDDDAPASDRLKVRDAVDAWIAENPSTGGPAPFVIVATAGGGSTAAFWTATVLGGLRDADPSFATKLFAISGVSGGALGAAAFAAVLAAGRADDAPLECLVRKYEPGRRDPSRADGDLRMWPEDEPFWRRVFVEPRYVYDGGRPYRRCAQAVVSGDFIAPVFASLAFPDLLFRLLPLWQWGDDRARAIELAFEYEWTQRRVAAPGVNDIQRPGFEAPFLAFGPRREGPWAPALLLNGTSVDTGRRIIASQLWFDGTSVLDDSPFNDDALDLFTNLIGETTDIRLSTAVTTAARFPIVLPAGTLVGPREVNGTAKSVVLDRVVDGGYFENFGAATADDLLRYVMRPPLGEPRRDCRDEGGVALYGHDLWRCVRPVVIQISSNSSLERDINPRPDSAPGYLSGLWAPFETLLGTRNARGWSATKSLEQDTEWLCPSDGNPECAIYVHFRLNEPDAYEAPEPLGWWLSSATQSNLDEQLCKKDNQYYLGELAAPLGVEKLDRLVCGR